MNKVYYHIIYVLLMVAGFVSCGQQQKPAEEREESREAKQLMQGIWLDEDTEAAVFQAKGDTIYYADSTSMPVYFKIIDDTLYVGSSIRYHIEKQTEHVLWYVGTNGETSKYVKNDDKELDAEFKKSSPQVLTLTDVLKRDTVVFSNGERYHLYIVVNPTKYKVTRQTVNEDGLDVENVYYDNIIHLSIFHGASQIFSRDFRKSFYEKNIPVRFLQQAILNDMQFVAADAAGFHFHASVCIPDETSCYLVEHVVSYNGELTTKLSEY